MTKTVKLNNITFGGKAPFVFISGPCVIESRRAVLKMAGDLKKITKELKIPFVFKASYDKANRTSIDSFRGPGIEEGLSILAEVKEKYDVPVTTDVHSLEEVEWASQVVDIIQIPAFLCRQTDLIIEAARSGRIVNIKKGQFLAPWDTRAIIKKAHAAGSQKTLLTDRGTTFGYNNLVSDFRAIEIMRDYAPVVFDASHSVQQPGGLGDTTGGNSEFIPLLARCAVAAGIAALFMETHTNPKKAMSDGPNMLPISKVKKLLSELIAIDRVVKGIK